MKQILFATSNESKSKRFSEGLLKNNIEVLNLKDLNIKLEDKEDGKTAIENALIKAREGYKKSGMPTIGMDDTLYLENVPEEKQPGLFVRRVNGKTLADEDIWLTQNQLAEIYKTTQENISMHIKNIYKDGELQDI